MLAISIMVVSTFLQEVAASLGKGAVRRHIETAYSLVFLAHFCSLLFFATLLMLGADFRFSADSLPTLLPRIVLSACMALTTAMCIIKADRSTVGLLGALTIPLLLVVDILLGYHITNMQITGVVVMFGGLAWGFRHNPRGRKGAPYVLAGSLLGVVTASLYKWDITHFNSVVAEQLIVQGVLVAFFFLLAASQTGRSKTSPFRLLFKPWSGGQSLAGGLSVSVESFAYTYAPASVIIALKRSLGMFWAMLSGNHYFHERRTRQKVFAGMVVVVGLGLFTLPYVMT